VVVGLALRGCARAWVMNTMRGRSPIVRALRPARRQRESSEAIPRKPRKPSKRRRSILTLQSTSGRNITAGKKEACFARSSVFFAPRVAMSATVAPIAAATSPAALAASGSSGAGARCRSAPEELRRSGRLAVVRATAGRRELRRQRGGHQRNQPRSRRRSPCHGVRWTRRRETSASVRSPPKTRPRLRGAPRSARRRLHSVQRQIAEDRA
jgi:hypothetical protein